MKHLRVKWVPETVMMMSLTIATPQNTNTSDERGRFEQAPAGDVETLGRRGKLIVISGNSELQARVMTSMPLEAA